MKKSPTIKKRFYELALLCSSSLNAAQVKLIASCLDIDEYELATKMTQLHETGYRRIEISEHLERTRDLHFMRLMELERRLATSMYYDDQEHKESIRKRIVRERRHLSERQTELRTRPGSVTHAMVAQIVGVPKGTIDSGMSALKKIVQRIVDDRT